MANILGLAAILFSTVAAVFGSVLQKKEEKIIILINRFEKTYSPAAFRTFSRNIEYSESRTAESALFSSNEVKP